MGVLRIGLIGASRVAKLAIIDPSRNMPGIGLAAVAARDVSRARVYASEHGIERVHGTYADLLADPEVDLAYIGTPPSTHVDLAMRAIAARKPVLVEKPFSLNAAGARRVLASAAAASVPVFEAMHSPHHRLFARILALVESGELGRLRHLDAEFSAPIPQSDPIRWNAGLGGGALMDLGVYPLAWIRRVVGEGLRVTSGAAEFRHGVDSKFEASLLFASGVAATLRSSMTVSQPVIRMVVEGENGRLDIANPLVPQRGHALHVIATGKQRTERLDGPSSFEAQLAAVKAHLHDGVEFPFPPDDFVRAMAAIDSIRAAIGIRDPVTSD